MARHNELGKKGEIVAKNYLQQKGYEILETNWRHGKAEVDIIAKDQNILVFTEVKTRVDDFFQSPEESIDAKKMSLLTNAAGAYMHKIEHEWEIRFDVISIIIKNESSASIDHFEDAFFPEW